MNSHNTKNMHTLHNVRFKKNKKHFNNGIPFTSVLVIAEWRTSCGNMSFQKPRWWQRAVSHSSCTKYRLFSQPTGQSSNHYLFPSIILAANDDSVYPRWDPSNVHLPQITGVNVSLLVEKKRQSLKTKSLDRKSVVYTSSRSTSRRLSLARLVVFLRRFKSLHQMARWSRVALSQISCVLTVKPIFMIAKFISPQETSRLHWLNSTPLLICQAIFISHPLPSRFSSYSVSDCSNVVCGVIYTTLVSSISTIFSDFLNAIYQAGETGVYVGR